mgnify:CR=1 FL=1|tara:strand:- start:1104 stop:2717 length:1614 start_codon:yes stop_codon:yes gene_type:complete
MLAAVAPSATYENLNNYIFNANTPTSFGHSERSARQPLSIPNGQIPNTKTPIPNSSATPGKQTNQRITYARVQTELEKDAGNLSRVPTLEGDVVFVHRKDGSVSQGYDTNRVSRVASLVQLNKMLAMGTKEDIGNVVMAPNKNPSGRQLQEDLGNPITDRWEDCKILGLWAPDGVVAGNEHENFSTVSNPGDLYNIAIGGPTLLRNSAVGEFPQHVDDGARALDKVFVGLIATENRKQEEDGSFGENEYFSFEYKLFTSRQLIWARLGPSQIDVRDMERNAIGGINSIGPTADEFMRMVSVWRLGSVLDRKAGMLPYNCVMLNVVVEECTTAYIQSNMNEFFGDVFTLSTGEDATVSDILNKAFDVVKTNSESVTEIKRAVESTGYDFGVIGEVMAWEAIDIAHKEDKERALLRGENTPLPPKVNQNVVAFGRSRLYEPPSHALTEFHKFLQTEKGKEFVSLPFLKQTDSIASVGRAVALRGNTRLVKTLDSDTRAKLDRVASFHGLVVSLRPAFRAAEKLIDGAKRAKEAGSEWPI